ncbi:NAD-dependent protein deacetylase [Aurantivibrio infirmus]
MTKLSPIKNFVQLINTSKNTLVFTGAGISTESGIPDFRSPGGVWDKYQPIDFADFISSEELRRESWRRKIATDKVISNAKPNDGHLALTALYKAGKISKVITQNIDNLHQDSGIPESSIIELHGNSSYAKCLDCGIRYELADIFRNFTDKEQLPTCVSCKGIIKTATISFGQAMPVEEMRQAEKATLACDLFVAIGSSLSVYPAAGFPQLALRNAAKLIIINRDPTPLDEIATLVLNEEIGATLSETLALLEL